MATVDGLTKARMLAIEAASVVDGEVDAFGHLILKKHDDSEIDAGNVVGPTGPPAPSFGNPAPQNGVDHWVRIVQVNGVNDTNGAQLVFDFSGGQNFGGLYNYSATVMLSQRGADLASLDVYEDAEFNSGIVWYTRKISAYVFEVWVKLPAYAGPTKVEPRQTWNATWFYSPDQTTAPSNLVTTNVYVHNPNSQVAVEGVLPENYRGGPTKVKINGVLSSATYEWLTPYIPGKSRTVSLQKIGPNWYISGQNQRGYYEFPLNTTKWNTYSDATASSVFSSKPRVTRLVSGIVVLSGLLMANGVPADATVVGTLPADCRPDKTTIYPVEYGDVARAVTINTDGTITTRGSGWSTNQYLSLDGIAFPAAGVATWTPVGSGGSAWGSSFSSDAGFETTYGAPSFWKDPYGFVWFRGLTKIIATVSADNTRVIDLPTTHRAHLEQHYRATALDGYAGLGAHPNNGLNWKSNTTGTIGGWISLAGFIINTVDGQANNPWVNPAAYANGWVRNGLGFPNGSYLHREDGLCTSQGLMTTGGAGTRLMSLKDNEMWPQNGRIILSSISNNARSRIDIGGEREALGGQNEPGSVVLTQGSSWFSLDGKVWVP